MRPTDEQLVARVRQGEREAFGELVDRYRDMVYGLGYYLTGDFEAARDLAQEAFLQAFVKLRQLREPEKFAGWLRKIAANVQRAQARRPQVSTVALEAAATTADARPPSETKVVVREALARLRAPERLALTLAYVDGYSQAEIAGFLGVRPGTVKTRLARARQHLRTEVVAMVEHEFGQHALPPEFRENVVRAVEALVSRFAKALPPEVEELCTRLREDSRQAWQDLLAQMPAPHGQPLREQGEAPRVRVGELPEDLRPQVRRAMCLTWMHGLLAETTGRLSWIEDFDRLWIRFWEKGESEYAWFADVPGDAGYISSVALGPEEGDPRGEPPAAEEVDRVLAECATPELGDLVARLRALVPGKPGSLADALYTEMQRVLKEARDQLLPEAGEAAPVGHGATAGLPAPVREAMAAGRSVSPRDLPEQARELVRQGVFLHWGSVVLQLIEHPPWWLLRSEEASIEFGLYTRDLEADFAGKEYVKLWGAGSSTHQTGIY
jgi:RNA polymerase sigma-70 factor (ECF subfamily)